MEWIADEWEVELPMDVRGADTLVVFSSIEIMKFPENIAAIAKILNKAGEKWTMSHKGREVVNFGFYEGDEERTKLFIRASSMRPRSSASSASWSPSAAMPTTPCAGQRPT